MVIGGAALTKALPRPRWQRGIDIFAGYGMSESGPILTIAQLKEHELSGDLDAEAELRTQDRNNRCRWSTSASWMPR